MGVRDFEVNFLDDFFSATIYIRNYIDYVECVRCDSSCYLLLIASKKNVDSMELLYIYMSIFYFSLPFSNVEISLT